MIIYKKHFDYLVIQRGEVAHERGDFKRWQAAYESSIESLFQSLLPVLPARCGHIVDIGSGLGGIDILLSRHFGQPRVTLIDGLDNEPIVKWSFEPFSNAKVALDFHARNGCLNTRCVWPFPEKLDPKPDLIVSFVAYGFHIPPGNYLADLQKVVHKDTVLIFDVRISKRDWLEEFVRAFGTPQVLERGRKHVRLAFNAA